jgi:tRNA (guanine-N7-)-methyltransferase
MPMQKRLSLNIEISEHIFFVAMNRLNKLQKFAALLSYPNVFENFNVQNPVLIGANGASVNIKGKWGQEFFKNDHPITLELACGRGEYSVALAQMYPDRNFIGVDIKGARIWKGADFALKNNLSNVAFLRTRIEQIDLFFEPQEISEIWITFPDPFLLDRRSEKRLTSPFFFEKYRQVLKKDALVHLKTDELRLHEYTLGVLSKDSNAKLHYQDDDIYTKALPLPELAIKTHYEKMHLAEQKTIKYSQFQLT